MLDPVLEGKERRGQAEHGRHGRELPGRCPRHRNPNRRTVEAQASLVYIRPRMVTTAQATARARVFRRAAAQFPRVFGDRLRSLRLAAGFSQAECATRCGISLRSLSRYENNTTEPSAPVLLLLAAGIGVEPSDLLGVAHEQGSPGR